MRANTSRIQRPTLLIVLVILNVLSGAVAIGIGLYLTIAGLTTPSQWVPIGALFGAFLFVPALFELLLAHGLWKMRPWAWWLGVIVHGLVGVVDIIRVYDPWHGMSMPDLLAGLVLLASVACLFIPQVRRAFMPAAKQAQVSGK